MTIDGDLAVLGDTTVENIDEISITDPVVKLNSIIDDDGNETVQYIPLTSVPEFPGVRGQKLPVAGLEINRGQREDINGDLIPAAPRRTNVQLRYNDLTADKTGPYTGTDEGFWEATDDGLDYYPLNSSNFQLVNDPDPHLGGNLNVNGYKIVGIKDTVNNIDGDIIIEADRDLILRSDVNVDGLGQIKFESPLSIKYQTTDPIPRVDYNVLYAKAPGSGGTGIYVTNTNTTDELVSRSKAIIFGLIF